MRDQRLVTLLVCSMSRGNGVGSYTLDGEQARLISHVGFFCAAPDSEALLNELVRAAADDTAAYWAGRTKELADGTARGEKAQKKLEALQTENVELRHRVEELKGIVSSSGNELVQAREQLDFLKTVLGEAVENGNGNGHPDTKKKRTVTSAPRRRRYKNEPNIYETLNRKGEATGGFQVGYTEDRRQRWATVDSLEEAIALRAKLREAGKIKPQGFGVGAP